MKAILLARVSSKEQEEGQSIPAQVRRLTEYAEKKNFTIEEVFQITESSTKDTRREFEKILALIKKSRQPLALIADTIDRVQRSFKESVILDELRKEGKVEIHFYRENLVLNTKSNSADLLRWDMGVMFARSYVLQLSDNVKRSKEESLKKGICIGRAPLGYMRTNDAKGAKTIVPDPDSQKLVQEMFKQYGTGNYSLQTITALMKDKGLRTASGKSLAKSQIESMLKNPFYAGEMSSKQGVFAHHYEKLVSLEEFQHVQNVLNGYHKKPFKSLTMPFILRGLVTCGNCGCLISPEIKKGKYVYYSCTNAKGICSRTYVREEELLAQLTPFFDNIALPEEAITRITEYLREVHQSEQTFYKEEQALLRKELDKLQNRLSKMYDDKLDGMIDDELYQQKFKEMKARQQEIVVKMQSHVKADETFYITANTVLNLASRAKELFESSEVDEKRQLLNFVFQNLVLEGKKLVHTLREPFSMIMTMKSCPSGWGQLDSNQRSHKTRDLQSLAIAAMRYPQRGKQMLAVGLEPTTVRLQIGCSTS